MFSIKRLIDIFSRFPGVGPKMASRFVFYLIKQPKTDIDALIKAIEEIKSRIKTCLFCFNPFEAENEERLCPICNNLGRNRKLISIVEKESDLIAIENTKRYNGLYFVLGRTFSNFKKEDILKMRLDELISRIKNPSEFIPNSPAIEEVIIATNPTTEGESTGLLIERKLKDAIMPAPKITRLGRGLPIGGELEYADEETLENAFNNRK